MSTYISPEREEEIVQIWFGWLVQGIFVIDKGFVTWGNYEDCIDKVAEHNAICLELDDRQHPAFSRGWDTTLRRFKSIPLIEALS